MARKRLYPENILHDVKVDGITVDDLDFSRLTERESEVIRLYYIENILTQKAIAEMFGVTQQRMNQIIWRAIRKIRHGTRMKLKMRQ